MGTVEHSHQGLLIIDARERDDNGGVRDDQIQVVFGEVKVGCLKSQFYCHHLLYVPFQISHIKGKKIILDGFGVKYKEQVQF